MGIVAADGQIVIAPEITGVSQRILGRKSRNPYLVEKFARQLAQSFPRLDIHIQPFHQPRHEGRRTFDEANAEFGKFF